MMVIFIKWHSGKAVISVIFAGYATKGVAAKGNLHYSAGQFSV